jgi:hypothetical protein
MTGGRLSEALAAFDSAAVLREDGERSRVTVWCLVTYALGGPTLPEPHQRRCEAELRATGSDNPRAAERWGIAALAAGAGGDSGTVSILLARFDSLPPGEGGRRWRSLLEAERLALRGDFRGALEYSEPVVAYDSAGVIGGPFLRSAAHLRRAKWREAVGERARAEEELAWYQNTDFRGWPAAGAQAGEVDAVFGSVARLEQARLALARGEVDACGLVKRVAWLWRDAEPSPGKDHILAPLLLRCR